MFKATLSVSVFSLALVSGAQAASDLIVSGVIDGPLTGGKPKAIELFTVADIADLGIYGVGLANNGGGSDGEEFTLNGSAAAGSYLYITNDDVEFDNFFGFAPNFMSSVAGGNGDDAIELFMNGSVVDVFGDINTDGTGQPWEYTDGWAYRVDETGPDGSDFVLTNWTFSGIDALDSETANTTAFSAFPVGTYQPSVVPLPAAAWLFGSAALGMISVARRRG